MSSYDMIDDEKKMNQVNPFATSGPGAWSNPYPFAPKGPLIEQESRLDSSEPSPMCLADISCSAPFEDPISCPLKRPLEPTREFEPDIGTGSLDALYGNTLVPKEKNPVLVPRFCDTGDGCTVKKSNWWVILVLILAIVLAFRKSIF